MKTIIRIFAGVLGALAFFVFASEVNGGIGLFLAFKSLGVAGLWFAYGLAKMTYSAEEWQKMMSEE